jgi:hypothetical protein
VALLFMLNDVPGVYFEPAVVSAAEALLLAEAAAALAAAASASTPASVLPLVIVLGMVTELL